jgi:hypothetical protein
MSTPTFSTMFPTRYRELETTRRAWLYTHDAVKKLNSPTYVAKRSSIMNTVLFGIVYRPFSDKHKRDFAYKVKLI